MRRLVAALALAAAVLAAPALRAQAPAAGEVASLLQVRLDALRGGAVPPGGERIVRAEDVAAFYARRRFAPAWTGDSDRAALLAFIDGVAADGLLPAHYHRAAIAARAGVVRDAVAAVELELLATDAVAQALHDVRIGRTDVAERAIGRSAPLPDALLDEVVRALPERGGAATLAGARPRHFVYLGLVDALARLRAVEATGGWPAIAAGPALRLDSADVRVPVLRARLVLEGDLAAPGAGTAARVFDGALAQAVRAFQHRHGLNEDGVVGPATRAQLNVPVSQRIAQVRVNLERARWLAGTLPETFVAVNVAGAKVYVVRAGSVVLEKRAIVGKAYTLTPVFTAHMTSIDLNPTWTVPPGIVGEVLAEIRRDAGWLAREGMQVLDRGGRVLDAGRIAFSRYGARTFPYTFRQVPGARNPLGAIKFVLPNPYNVYLHDTPARVLFAEEQRLFSHGCIRVQDPLALALAVLDDAGWTRAMLEDGIATGATRTIPLAVPIPVYVLYWTASTDLHGELHFYPDVYDRDAAVLRALDEP